MSEGAIFTVAAALMVLGCTGGCAQRAPAPRSASVEVKELAKGNGEFAWEMYGQLRGEPGNILFSPYSLRVALAMAYAGAAEEARGKINAWTEEKTNRRRCSARITRSYSSSGTGLRATSCS